MTLTLSIGGHSMSAGFYSEDGERKIFTVSVHKRMTPDDFYLQLSGLANLSGGKTPKGAIIASVAPRMTVAATRAAEKLCGAKPVVLGPGVKTGIDIKINDPSQLGADLVAMSCAVAEKYPLPAVLISISETTTISYIDGKSRYLGTIIHPGPAAMLQSLVESAELLNPVPIIAPERLLGRNTEESIQSGLIYGTAGLVSSITERLRAEQEVASVIATGELAEAVLPFCAISATYDESLLSDGLFYIFNRQKKYT